MTMVPRRCEALSLQSSGPILRVVDADPPSGTSRS